MPPKRKSKALTEVSTPKASATPAQDEDAMDIDTPKASETPRAADTPTTSKPNGPSDTEILNDLWTEDQTSSLFKAIIRWKPSGMHKHFRMIAISEHLRNHGFDPDVETHTRIPGIWRKLEQFFNMDMIDERDNSFDYVNALGGDEAPEEIYRPFELPPNEFHDLMWARAAADENEPDNWSESEVDKESTTTKPTKSTRKRKRADTATAADGSSVAGSATAKTTRRSSTVEDTDQETPAASSPVGRSARRARSQKRAAAKAKTESAASEGEGEEEEEDNGDDDEEEGGDEEENEDSEGGEEEDEEEETEAPTTRSSGRGSNLRGRGRGRGRGKPGRKRA
ncbi:chromatin modification-related protein EAF7-domain-containing protein [Xylariaceae sp. FL0255]|nr:chromatin modification-related protein EAF7-domain-containing protein [Xylariaceae sp. FL0255]